ncbi:unnamed protein product [Diatraea saccharalis]|uniref:C2H2-type domain-containing protein n=1 Tax=Diatraea saccharalis TaxID=40085 RepID=A0A9N9R6W2_9NEOP|nr:unnamed protein product [Diatraea saccharalis]
MFSVKVECKKVSICCGCLSTDRRIVLVNNHLDIFFSLLGVQRDCCQTQVLLCWECIAHLKKIQKFQNRIQNAQFVLQRSYELEKLPNNSLTSLTTVKKDYYDISIDYETSKKEKDKEDEKNRTINDIKQENDEDSNQLVIDDSFSDNELLTIDYNKLKKLEVIDDTIKEESDLKYRRTRYYMSKTTVKRLDVDATELKTRWAKVNLTEEEIEELLVRDKKKVGRNALPHKCSQCKNTYKRGIDLRRHETFNHNKPSFPTKCKECRVEVNSWESLKEHWRKHNFYYKCDVCNWLSHSMASLTRHHRRFHTTMYCCNTCDVTCRTLREFSEHYKMRHERLICDHCSKSFIKKRSLEIHIKRHHTPATCLECNKSYAHYHVLENHFRMYHPHMVRADNRTELAYCVECDKQFPSVYKYRRHLATAAKHTPPKPVRVPCPECGKVFARKIRMTNHYNSVHRNISKHRCDICNKNFCSAFSARTHRQHVHEKIPMPKNKMCDICGRGFSTNRILTNHRRTHTGERPYKCAHCPATFAQRTAMKTHERTQHKAQWDSHSALSAAATLLELGDRDGN